VPQKVDYSYWEYSGQAEIELSTGSGEITFDNEGAIRTSNYGGTWVGEVNAYFDLTLEQAIELSVLLTSRIIPYLEEKENANSKED
jgi:hypothetical protein